MFLIRRLLILASTLYVFNVQADTFAVQQTLNPTIPGTPEIADGFGQTVKLYDKWLFVAAPNASPDGKANEGAIYVYRKKDSAWTNTQIISTNGTSDQIGTLQIEMYDKWLLVASIGTPMGPIPEDVPAEQDFTGSILIYRYDDAAKLWKFAQSIDRSTPGLSELTSATASQQGACFGLRFSMDPKMKTLMVGAQYQQGQSPSGEPLSNAGAVYAFKLNLRDQWVFSQKITNPDGIAANDTFGANVAIKDRFALVSNFGVLNIPKQNSNGTVYVFHFDNGQWRHMQTLTGDQQGTSIVNSPNLGTINMGDGFGSSLAIDHRWAVIGAPLESKEQNGPLCGAAYFYRLGKVDGVKQLTRTQKIFSDDPAAQGTAFLNIALHNDTALIPDPTRAGPAGQSQGGVMVFRLQGDDSWQQVDTLYDPEGKAFSYFGVGVAKNERFYVGGTGTTLAGQFFASIGNPVVTPPTLDAGKVVIFKKN